MIIRHPDGSSDRWTYAELARTSSRLASAWKAAGLVRGDKVAALVNQQVEAFIGALAAWRSGMVYVPLFAGFGTDASCSGSMAPSRQRSWSITGTGGASSQRRCRF